MTEPRLDPDCRGRNHAGCVGPPGTTCECPCHGRGAAGQAGPAGELRAAAKLIRERAANATPGPWRPDPGNNVSGNVRADGRLVIDGGGYPGDGTAKPIVFGAALTADATYIAGMHPGVALAVADWLDRFADPVYCYGPVEYDAALNIARAYLGSGQ